MSMQSEGKDRKGRNYDQVAKDGSSAAGTLGTGGTGDLDRELTANRSGNVQGGSQQRNTQQGDAQQRGRTDDLLARDEDSAQREGFMPSEEAGELQTGLNGIESLSTGKAGNRQSEE